MINYSSDRLGRLDRHVPRLGCVCLLLGLFLVPLLLSGCDSKATVSSFPTPRVTKTWTPLPRLTSLPTYTPSLTPMVVETPLVVAQIATRVPPPTIPVMTGSALFERSLNSRASSEGELGVVVNPPEADNAVNLSWAYEGQSTDCCKWPVTGRITSNVTANHVALDIATTLGTPVVAADEGRVVAAGWDNSGYGYRVIVDHGGGLRTLYAHLSSYPVELGDEVNQGQMIGKIGSTGRSTGPHLHFEVRYYGNRVTPWDFLP